MANQKYFLRILSILNRIDKGDYPSQKEILSYLKKRGFSLRTRAFERDKKTAFEMFGIKIKYSAFEKGYYIENDFDDDFNSGKARELINLFSSIKIAGNNNKILSFERRKAEGTELMVSIIDAINNNRILKFTYKKHFENSSTERFVEPYMLKESLGRWYLIAKDKKDNKIKTFGLDRIGIIYSINELFSKPKDLDINELYKDAFGVTNVDKVHKIIFDVFGVDTKYILTYPLHHSQEVLYQTEEKIRFTLKVSITKDFIMELMKYIPNIEILEPKILREEIYNRCIKGTSVNLMQEKNKKK